MSKVSRIRCLVPFTSLSVHHHGYCYSCCPTWTTIGTVGRIDNSNSIMDVWNNERMQFLRSAVLNDQLNKVCNFKYCPIAIKGEFIDLESMKKEDPIFNNVIDQIMDGKTILNSHPSTFEVANTCKCNLKCIMCVSTQKISPKDELLDERLFSVIIPEILPKISNLFLSGNGEVLFNAHSRKFLQQLDTSSYPSLKIQLLTNGIMFTPKMWDSISHNRYEDISVSIDAATKDTYEKIRKNGNWDLLLKNLEFIAELRRNNVFNEFSISFIVMKSNFREMKSFAELGLKLGCDKIVFQKIFGYENIRENINFTKNMSVFTEIAEILTDPIFSCKGVDTALVDDYKQYLGNKTVSRISEYKTRSIESFSHTPIKALNALLKKHSSIRTIIRKKKLGYQIIPNHTNTDKIRILHIIKSLNLGGAETNLFNLVQASDENKFELHVAYSQGGEIEDRFLKSGVKLFKFASDGHKIKSFASLPIIAGLAAYIKRNKIDVVHTHVFNGQLWGGIAAKIAGKKVIEHVHDFRYLDPDEFQRRRGTNTQYKYSRFFQWLTDAVVVLTQQNADFLLVNGFQENTKIHQIRNGIPLVEGRLSSGQYVKLKSSFDIPHGSFVISTLSRMSEEKNIDLILRIAPVVKQQVPSAVFIIAGNGPLLEGFKKQLDATKHEYIKFIGFYDNVRELLSISDLFLLPSFLELHSIAILEAMSMGVPLITSKDVGCNNDFITQGKDGFLLDPFKDDGWAETIIELSIDSCLRLEVGQSAKETCDREFNITTTATKLEKLYEHVLNR